MFRLSRGISRSLRGIPSQMESSQVYNLLWLSPRFAHEKGPQYHDPIPEKTVANVLNIAERNNPTDVKLWVDSQRLTDQQMLFLNEMCGRSSGNLSVQDLRTISKYRRTPLFNQSDTSSNWRADKHTVIWRQVDAARLLTALQGNYEQSFYSDTDVTNLTVSSKEVQDKINKYGIVLNGGQNHDGSAWFENGMFGFNRKWRGFFGDLYKKTVQNVETYRENGFQTFSDEISRNLRPVVNENEIVFQCRYDGYPALHPGEEGQTPGGIRRI